MHFPRWFLWVLLVVLLSDSTILLSSAASGDTTTTPTAAGTSTTWRKRFNLRAAMCLCLPRTWAAGGGGAGGGKRRNGEDVGVGGGEPLHSAEHPNAGGLSLDRLFSRGSTSTSSRSSATGSPRTTTTTTTTTARQTTTTLPAVQPVASTTPAASRPHQTHALALDDFVLTERELQYIQYLEATDACERDPDAKFYDNVRLPSAVVVAGPSTHAHAHARSSSPYFQPLVIGERYQMSTQIDCGSFASVVLAHDRYDHDHHNNLVALKIPDMRSYRTVLREMEVMRAIRSRTTTERERHHLMVYRDYLWITKNGYRVQFVLVMDYLPLTLEQLWSARPLTIQEIQRFSHQLLSAVATLHSLGYVHTDIKPSNILVRKNGDELVLADFGGSRKERDLTGSAHNFILGTVMYNAPELRRF